MSDFKFNCPHCEQSLEAPEEMLGQTIECPSCSGSIQLPEPEPATQPQSQPAPSEPKKKIITQRPKTTINTRSCPYCGEQILRTAQKCRYCGEFLSGKQKVQTNLKEGALIGVFICFMIGIIVMFMSLMSFLIYGPLFLVAFILSIVAIAQKRVVGGIIFLLLTLIAPSMIFVGLGAYRVSETVDHIDTTSLSPNEKGVEIVEWDVTYKSSRSTGSVRANWKIHLRNGSGKESRGHLWLYGVDKDGFQCFENLYQVFTTIPPRGEIKRIEEVFFQPGEYEKIDKFRIAWKPM